MDHFVLEGSLYDLDGSRMECADDASAFFKRIPEIVGRWILGLRVHRHVIHFLRSVHDSYDRCGFSADPGDRSDLYRRAGLDRTERTP